MQDFKDVITVKASSVSTNDMRGNQYYRGCKIASVLSTLSAFYMAENYWASQKINGQPVKLNHVCVMTTPTSVVAPRAQTFRNPLGALSNRVAWYNVNFTIGDTEIDTGWLCHETYQTSNLANSYAANDVVHDLSRALFAIRHIKPVLQQKMSERQK